MRIIIYGTGAIGGGIAAALTRSGHETTAIARGAQLSAIREHGLTLRTPTETFTQPLDVVATPREARIGPDDAILLAMKGQHTAAALEDLRAAGVVTQPIFCLQNGVGNEPRALRYFANVHGVTVMMPAIFVQPGEVAVQSQPKLGLFYIGRYPSGADSADDELAGALTKAGFAAFTRNDVMASKHGKLIMNLSNIIGAALGHNAPEGEELREAAKAEAIAVFRKAGVSWEDVGMDHPDRKAHMNWTRVPGVEAVGTSTAQSLVRGTGSVETDWLNGEIVLLGRLHDVPTPVNAALTRIGARMAQEGQKVGSVSVADIYAEIDKSNG
ncbi:ketopantoate reductase family protein [Maritimibacter dapengensis]|uniref:2-dehydropantoate 2-reductase n=1 Tax=Maritimibacter dapengensis TaxID=2836868 RepID=A0ABS6T3U2_9RHOB|nr:2-dehydropantoate 2-reductase N-terminal domain-containing protein [Maritimibacter dapengensis]MBV7379912.1 ketopantoate reductase family protein [Maritimibacter dapengensis]